MNSISFRTQTGVSLLENLVALLVITIGLLGIAALQIYTLKSGTMSANRLTAIQQANLMADLIRANSSAVFKSAGSSYPYDGVTPASAMAMTAPDCVATKCSDVAIAAYDIHNWAVSNDDLLPGETNIKGGYITRQDLLLAGGNVSNAVTTELVSMPRSRYTITIHWDGDRTGAKGINCPPQTDLDMDCFKLEFDI